MLNLISLILFISISYSKCLILDDYARSIQYSSKDLPFSDVDPGEPLLLTPLIEANKLEEAKQASKVTHGDFKDVESYSGFITVNKAFNSNLFFWFFPAARDYTTAPVVIWLQGGPGSSSLYGLFVQNGPFEFVKEDELQYRKYSWSWLHSVIYIDNPVGTGFSFTDDGGYASNETQIGQELYEFLQQFYTLFSELQQNDLIITGESYAGKYIPAIGYTIFNNNPTAKLKINLQGLAIGNGLTDPIHQTGYADYFYQLGLINDPIKLQIKAAEDAVISDIQQKNYRKASDNFFGILYYFTQVTGIKHVYNYFYETDPTEPFIDYYSRFVQRNDIRGAIHVGNLAYDSKRNIVKDNLRDDITKSVAPWVEELLKHYKVLIYSGQMDIIVPYPLTENYLLNLNTGCSDYRNMQRYPYKVNNLLAGYVKNCGNITNVLIRNAGHMVPYDQPQWAHEMIYKFVRNIPLPAV